MASPSECMTRSAPGSTDKRTPEPCEWRARRCHCARPCSCSGLLAATGSRRRCCRRRRTGPRGGRGRPGPPPSRRPGSSAAPRARPGRSRSGLAVDMTLEARDRLPRRIGGGEPVTKPVDHQDEAPAGAVVHRPGVAADLLARQRQVDDAELQAGTSTARSGSAASPCQRRASTAVPVSVDEWISNDGREAGDGPQAVARRAGGREAVGQATADVGHARSPVQRQDLQPDGLPRRPRPA